MVCGHPALEAVGLRALLLLATAPLRTAAEAVIGQ